MKITSLQMENVKRVKTVCLEPTPNGLTIIGGNNGQGKTSILDAIAFALGGERYRPSNLKREDAIGDPIIHIETDDGLVIERKGKNSTLSVTDKMGRRQGQTLLDEFVSKFAIDLPKFMSSSSVEKTKMLLGLIGIGDEIIALDNEEKAKYDTRLSVGRMKEQKDKAAQDMPYHEDAPKQEMSISELIKEQQEILARNGLREANRLAYEKNKNELVGIENQIVELNRRAEELRNRIEDCDTDFKMEDTTELEAKIAAFEEINAKVRDNRRKQDCEDEAAELKDQYDMLTAEIDDIRKKRIELLNSVELPYPNLSVKDGEIILNGKSWDCMSGSQQLIVGCSIASKLNPKCRFVLMDKTEQFDLKTLAEFDEWAKSKDLQIICTRVSTGGECKIIIEDGEVSNSTNDENEGY